MAVTAQDIKDRYADQLHVAAIKVPAYAAGLAPVALAAAERDVSAILGAAGYTPAQVATWTGHDATVTLQSLYWMGSLGALLDSGATGRLIKALLDTLDQRTQLAGMALFDAAGEYIVSEFVPVGFGKSKIIGPDGTGDMGEPFRDSLTGTWRRQ